MAEARRLPVRIGSFADFMDPDADFEVQIVRTVTSSRARTAHIARSACPEGRQTQHRERGVIEDDEVLP